jgi:dipeptidyl-peptidase-3
MFIYRDPGGARTDWLAAVGIADGDETKKMSQLVTRFTGFLRMLPWAIPGEDNGKGSFEYSELQVPDFAILHCRYQSLCLYL